MLKMNKYLRALGYDEKENPLFGCQPEDEVFNEDEFYNLDNTLDCILYSYISYFREKYADCGVPCRYETTEEWLADLDKVLDGLRLSIASDADMFNKEHNQQIKEARLLLVEIWNSLWV